MSDVVKFLGEFLATDFTDGTDFLTTKARRILDADCAAFLDRMTG
jgi:hypothetical protein